MGASSESMSSIFTVRSIGYLIGSIIAGWLFDKWNGNLFLAVACIFASVSLIITPFTSSFAMLMISIFCQGLALALLDTGIYQHSCLERSFRLTTRVETMFD